MHLIESGQVIKYSIEIYNFQGNSLKIDNFIGSIICEYNSISLLKYITSSNKKLINSYYFHL